ncbi:MAG: TRAP transporter substrate-binding protein DctP, partial [Planctomycetes bacterium]|nr:TRAP transporter substrate-binding protein DctP [Planctomycetota bacterium]
NNARPIRQPEDLKDLKMRSMQNSIHLDTFAQWGANPTPMSFSEMITAMQQGVIDGHDNAPDTVAANSMWEIQRFFSESRHFYAAKIFGASPIFWSRLSPEDQAMFQEIYYQVRDFERDLAEEQFREGMALIAKNGMEVLPFADMDSEAFRASVKPIWDKYALRVGADLIERIANHE